VNDEEGERALFRECLEVAARVGDAVYLVVRIWKKCDSQIFILHQVAS
jgi:hypothetical protein